MDELAPITPEHGCLEWAMEMQMGGDGGSIWVLWSEMMGLGRIARVRRMDGAGRWGVADGAGRRAGALDRDLLRRRHRRRWVGSWSRLADLLREAAGVGHHGHGIVDGGCGGWMMTEHHTGAPCSGGVPYMVYLQM
ncbi:hypothetical protein ACLOJK_030024 [Asimina triloba]